MRFKAIYRGRRVDIAKNQPIVRAIHIELSIENFNQKYNRLIEIYGRSKNDFEDSRRVRFCTNLDLIKSNKVKVTLTIAYKW